MAVKAAVLPTDMLVDPGVTEIDCNVTGAVTVSDADPLIPESEAVIVIGPPAPTPVATPVLLTMVASRELFELHALWLVMFLLEPSE